MAVLGYARVSISLESTGAQARELESAGAGQIFQDIGAASADKGQLQAALDALKEGDILLVTRLHRVARSTGDLRKILTIINGKGAGFRSLHEPWADTTAPHGPAVLRVLDGLVEFEQG
jgi:DNA invertase Pin-like site-specific DNA recombinase